MNYRKILADDFHNNLYTIVTEETARYILRDKKKILITTPAETAEVYYKMFYSTQDNDAEMCRCTIFVGPPDTGKTYEAIKICKGLHVPYILIMGREDLTLESILEDFTLENGSPIYKPSLALKALSGDEPSIIIIDEFNTLRTGVIKSLQPLLDETSETFEFRGKVYNKNLKCKFIFTLNEKDKGISVLPDAILSRSKLVYFDKVSLETLADRTGTSLAYVQNASNIYKVLNLMNLFGFRQINILKTMKDIDNIKAHFKGLCALKGVDSNVLETPEFIYNLTKLIKEE